MLFSKDLEMQSNLTIEEAISNLQQVTWQYGKGHKDNPAFQGVIREKEFTIYPRFDFSEGQLKPEIRGQLSTEDKSIRVSLKFRLPSFLKALMFLGTFNGLTLMLVMLLFPNLIDSPVWSKWWIVLIFLFIFFLVCKLYFDSRVFTSINTLNRVFEAN